MAIPIPIINSIINLGSTILDKVIRDPAQKDEAKLKLLELAQKGEFKEHELRYSAINTEASSGDKWTSRARPSFMYVMYIMILASIPFGIFYAINPTSALAISIGLKSWLDAIPEALWGLFGVGYVGYAVTRSYDKSIQNKLEK